MVSALYSVLTNDAHSVGPSAQRIDLLFFFCPKIYEKLSYNIRLNEHSIFCNNFTLNINCPISTKLSFILNFTFLSTWLHFISLAVGYCRCSGDCVDGLRHRLHRALHGCAWEQPARLWGRLCGTACGQAAQRVSIHTQASRQMCLLAWNYISWV